MLEEEEIHLKEEEEDSREKRPSHEGGRDQSSGVIPSFGGVRDRC